MMRSARTRKVSTQRVTKPRKADIESAADESRRPAAKRGIVRQATVRQGAPATLSRKRGQPVLLSGGNPQIAKAYGDAPVQAYITAMPGWKRDVGRRLDALITKVVPGVHKAVKWNSPFYGVDSDGWFLSFHCFDKYIKVAFFRGASLRPLPPVESKHKEVRYLHIHEDMRAFDAAQFTDWLQQAWQLPGERM